MFQDPSFLLTNQWPYNMVLMEQAWDSGYKVALLTMPVCVQVQRVLKNFEFSDVFDFITSRDDVGYGKPNPEI
jgi:FMN phosphatase YigB (HAD superfamily)